MVLKLHRLNYWLIGDPIVSASRLRGLISRTLYEAPEDVAPTIPLAVAIMGAMRSQELENPRNPGDRSAREAELRADWSGKEMPNDFGGLEIVVLRAEKVVEPWMGTIFTSGQAMAAACNSHKPDGRARAAILE